MSGYSGPAAAQDTCSDTGADIFQCEDGGAPATSGQVIAGGDVQVTIDTGFDVATADAAGIDVTANGDLVVTQAPGGTIEGQTGLTVQNTGAGSVSLTLAGNVTGSNSDGVYVRNGGSDIIIDTSAGSVSGNEDGIEVFNEGNGSLTITSADVTGVTGYGISALNYNPASTDLIIDTSAGSVIGGYRGIDARNNGTGTLSVTTGNVSAGSDTAIYLRNFSGDVSVDSSAGTVMGARAGVFVRNYDSGAISITTGDVSGGAGDGIHAVNFDPDTADIIIDSSAGSVDGGTYGIRATNLGSGALSITSADVVGGDDAGIRARNSGTNLTIDSSAGAVSGISHGIYARNYGSGALVMTTGDVSASNGDGIYARNSSRGKGFSLDSSGGAVTGANRGIFAQNEGGGSFLLVTADVSGIADYGIYARNNDNGTNMTVDTSAGAISGTNGLSVYQDGSGALSIITGDVTGANDVGISAYHYGTDISVDSSAGSVSGAQVGLEAFNRGTGTLSITTADVSSATGIAIYAYNYTSGTDVTIDTTAGSVSGNDQGISVRNNGIGTLTITTADVGGGASDFAIEANVGPDAGDVDLRVIGNVGGNAGGVLINNAGIGSTVIVNDGVIIGGTGEAVRSIGRSVALTNNGTLDGFVSLSGSDDTLMNAGTFLARADSRFGQGNDQLTNTGLFTVSVASPVSLLNLERFVNSGTVSLSDGVIGNNLVMDGDFVGEAGSTLELDISFASSTADNLIVAGSASGTSGIVLNPLDPVQSVLTSDILLVDAGMGSLADAFVLAGSAEAGFVEFELIFDEANNDFLLSTIPSRRAFQIGVIGEATRNIVASADDAWSQQMQSQRAAKLMSEGARAKDGEGYAQVWLTGHGSEFNRNGSGFFDLDGAVTSFDIGYEQDFFGFQTGIDFGHDTFRYGITGGYISSKFNFDTTSDLVSYDALNIGAYISLDTGGFFFNALAKYDDLSGDFVDPLSPFGSDQNVDASALGAVGLAGFLIGERTGLFLEPRARLSYTRIEIDGLDVVQGTFSFDDQTWIVGEAGARIGMGLDFGDRSGALYLAGDFVNRFEGEAAMAFASGMREVDITSAPFDDYIEMSGGVAIGDVDDDFSTSLEGSAIVGGDATGFGLAASFQIRF
ncbi:MAG: autotransporter outer membrane beta-barrel domain-containing protein [Pseudomonadota bacterium]